MVGVVPTSPAGVLIAQTDSPFVPALPAMTAVAISVKLLSAASLTLVTVEVPVPDWMT